MEICWQGPGGGWRCQTFVLSPGRPGGPPVDAPGEYRLMVHDAVLLASVKDIVQQVSDKEVRQALHDGISAAVKAMQQRAGEHVRISE
jgi:hypothetical protein